MKLQKLIALIKEDFQKNPTYRDGKRTYPNTVTTSCTSVTRKHVKDLATAHRLVGEVAALNWEMDPLFIDLEAGWFELFRELAMSAITQHLNSDPDLADENARRVQDFS